MSTAKTFALIPVCMMALACGGSATPDANAPEGQSAGKPADAPATDAPSSDRPTTDTSEPTAPDAPMPPTPAK